MMPSVLRLRPVGNAPPVSVHVYGVLPPVAARVFVYNAPTLPLGVVAVVT